MLTDSSCLTYSGTAYAIKGDQEKAIEAGCDAYLSKPINTRELPKVVAKMLSGQKQDNT